MTAAFRRRTGRKLGDLPRSVGEEESGVVCGACVWEKEGLLDSLEKVKVVPAKSRRTSKRSFFCMFLAPGFSFFASRDFFYLGGRKSLTIRSSAKLFYLSVFVKRRKRHVAFGLKECGRGLQSPQL